MSDSVPLDPAGVQHEIAFWRRFVQSERFQGWVKNEPTPELPLWTRNFAQAALPESVLDVGSGPVSILRGTLENIVTADPLTELYQQILDFPALGIAPPLPWAAEDIPRDLNRSFDLVLCSNALDHVVDVGAAFRRLAACVAPGGHLVIQGHVREADHENWAGFHTWNLFLEGEELRAEGRLAKHRFAADRHGLEHVHSRQEPIITGREWLTWVARRPLG